jgi:hypothetical protein
VYVPRDAATIMGDRVRRRREVIAKRRTWFVRLLIATGALAPFAIFFGGPLWLVFLGVAGGLGGYAFLLRRWKVQADRAAEVVRELPDIDEAVPADAPLAAGGEDVAVAYAEAPTFQREEPQARAGVRVRRWDG